MFLLLPVLMHHTWIVGCLQDWSRYCGIFPRKVSPESFRGFCRVSEFSNLPSLAQTIPTSSASYFLLFSVTNYVLSVLYALFDVRFYRHIAHLLKIDIEGASVGVLRAILEPLHSYELPLLVMVEVKSTSKDIWSNTAVIVW